MEECTPVLDTGLRGIKVARTRISDVDGKAGRLIYRGYLIQDLARDATYEEVAYLLLYENLPDVAQLADFKKQLRAERQLPEAVIRALQTQPANALPMDILQAATAMLASHDPDIRNTDREAVSRMAVRLIARLPLVLAAWERIRNGKEPLPADPELDEAASFLYLLSGSKPDPQVARYFDTCLVLHAEHSFNASTFAAREVASTRAHIYAAVAAAVGSLSGELHGGANVRVMEMLKAIGSPEAVEAYIEKILDAGQRIMGLGHAVYQTDDPRAHIIAPMSQDMGRRINDTRWYEISRVLEEKGKAVFKQRKQTDIYVNVDFYSASLYYAMGIPMDLFTPVFAIARVSGWTAHVIEEQFAGAAAKPMLYRPESDYVGDYCGPDVCTLKPLSER